MQTVLLLALALVVRSLPSVEGAADCRPEPGQRIVAAYSADFESVWHHAVPTTRVDRLVAARTGRVTGLGPSVRLVLALADDTAEFDASHPQSAGTSVFPYSPDFVRRYEQSTGRNYVSDMMAVAAPFLGSQWARTVAVTDLYETLFDGTSPAAGPHTFGSAASKSVLIVSGRARSWCWLERCFGDDGTSYAQSLAERGFRADLTDGSALAGLSVDSDGFVTGNGRRYEAMVLRHLSRRDAESYRRTFGSRPLATKVYATDTPVLYGAELTLSDPIIAAIR